MHVKGTVYPLLSYKCINSTSVRITEHACGLHQSFMDSLYFYDGILTWYLVITFHCTCIQPRPLYPTTTKIISIYKRASCISFWVQAAGATKLLLWQRDSHLSRARESPLTSKIIINRFLNAHFHIHLDFIFSDVKDTSLCFQTYAVSFSFWLCNV